jgi:hypothetical protein
MHPIRTLTWAVPTSWADAANGPLNRVNIYGIVTLNLYLLNGVGCRKVADTIDLSLASTGFHRSTPKIL